MVLLIIMIHFFSYYWGIFPRHTIIEAYLLPFDGLFPTMLIVGVWERSGNVDSCKERSGNVDSCRVNRRS